MASSTRPPGFMAWSHHPNCELEWGQTHLYPSLIGYTGANPTHQVCMMVYIFGDLRQLRKFELSRPRISAPKPLDASSVRPQISSPVPMYQSDSHSSSSFLPSYAFRRSRSAP